MDGMREPLPEPSNPHHSRRLRAPPCRRQLNGRVVCRQAHDVEPLLVGARPVFAEAWLADRGRWVFVDAPLDIVGIDMDGTPMPSLASLFGGHSALDAGPSTAVVRQQRDLGTGVPRSRKTELSNRAYEIALAQRRRRAEISPPRPSSARAPGAGIAPASIAAPESS